MNRSSSKEDLPHSMAFGIIMRSSWSGQVNVIWLEKVTHLSHLTSIVTS